MVFIDPKAFADLGFEKEVNRIMLQMSKMGKAYSHNTRLSTEFGKKYKDVMGDFIDVSRTNYRRKKNKVIWVPTEDIVVVPKKVMDGFHFHLERPRLPRLGKLHF